MVCRGVATCTNGTYVHDTPVSVSSESTSIPGRRNPKCVVPENIHKLSSHLQSDRIVRNLRGNGKQPEFQPESTHVAPGRFSYDRSFVSSPFQNSAPLAIEHISLLKQLFCMRHILGLGRIREYVNPS